MNLDLEKQPIVAICDDDPSFRLYLEKLIKPLNAKVLSCNSDLQLFESLELEQADLILLDICMSPKNGFEICEELKANKKLNEIPVIFVSGIRTEEDLTRCFTVGAVDYLQKPVCSAEFLARVRMHLQTKWAKEKVGLQRLKLRQLLQVVCHDFRNPLAYVANTIEFLKDDPTFLNYVVDELHEVVLHGLESLDYIREDMAIEDGKKEVVLQSVNLKEAIEESYRMVKHRMEEKDVSLEIDVEEEAYVMMESLSFINSIMNNLLTNAAKFSRPSSQVWVRCKPYSESQVIVSVEDNGIGMPPELVKNIFEMSEPTSRKGTQGELGSGFGMPLVRKYIKRYGGEVFVSSKDIQDFPDNSGTTISFTLNRSLNSENPSNLIIEGASK